MAATLQENLPYHDFEWCRQIFPSAGYGGARTLFDGELALEFATQSNIHFVPAEYGDRRLLQHIDEIVIVSERKDRTLDLRLTEKGAEYMERVRRAMLAWQAKKTS